MKQEELKELIKKCIEKNKRAQNELFKKFYGKMLSTVNRYINDFDSAQEVVQIGFIKIFEKVHAYNFNGSFEGWIRTIMVNCALDYLRKLKREGSRVENENIFKDEANFAFENELDEKITELKYEEALNAISMLSPAYRTVFNLFAIERYTHREIAEMLNISEGTSKSNYAKAKLNLQKILNSKFKTLNL